MGLDVGRFALELAEMAQQLTDSSKFALGVLERFDAALGVDSAMYMGIRPPRRPWAQVNKGPHMALIRRFVARPDRYASELERGRDAARRGGGAYLDHQVFSAAERSELPFFVELIRPQGITSQLVGLVQLRGQPLAAVHLCRHGHSRRFGARELAYYRSLAPLLGLAHAVFDAPAKPRTDALSAHEREIASLVARGLRNREIAALMGSSPNTIRNQLHRIFAKVGVVGRTELATWLARGER